MISRTIIFPDCRSLLRMKSDHWWTFTGFIQKTEIRSCNLMFCKKDWKRGIFQEISDLNIFLVRELTWGKFEHNYQSCTLAEKHHLHQKTAIWSPVKHTVRIWQNGSNNASVLNDCNHNVLYSLLCSLMHADKHQPRVDFSPHNNQTEEMCSVAFRLES